MDVRTTLAANEYAKAKLGPEAEAADSGPGQKLAQYAKDFSATLEEAESTAQQAMVGEADPQALVEALAQTQLAVETAVAVRDRVVEAYQEILRMPV